METSRIDTCNTCEESGVQNDFGINISERYKTFLWLWNKTGTSHMSQVLRYFGFNFYKIVGSKKILQTTSIVQQHVCKLFPGHENYKMMASIRNPYTKYFSWYKFKKKNEMERKEDSENLNHQLSIQEFKFFLESNLYEKMNFECSTFEERYPDYYVRVENMYDDYCTIPFIIQSDYFKSGLLKEFCDKKINETSTEKDWKDYFNESIADLIYYSSQEYFRYFKYDKNSWKK